MNRSQHLLWCKERALAYLPDKPIEAVTSMSSDLTKHPETQDLSPLLFMAGAMAAKTGNPSEVERWIDGFN